MANEKQETKTFYLRVKSSHFSGKYRIQKHTIGLQFAKFELNQDEIFELNSEGCKAWIEIGDEKKAAADMALVKKIRKSQTEKTAQV